MRAQCLRNDLKKLATESSQQTQLHAPQIPFGPEVLNFKDYPQYTASPSNHNNNDGLRASVEPRDSPRIDETKTQIFWKTQMCPWETGLSQSNPESGDSGSVGKAGQLPGVTSLSVSLRFLSKISLSKDPVSSWLQC